MSECLSDEGRRLAVLYIFPRREAVMYQPILGIPDQG